MNLLPRYENVYEGLVKWLKMRRDEYPIEHGNDGYGTIDKLLDEVRDANATGILPWQVE